MNHIVSRITWFSVKQITIRGIDYELGKHIRRIARRRRTSLNKAALELMWKGAGLSAGAGSGGEIGEQLDDLFGSWDPGEADEFDSAVAIFGQIDEAEWK